ncbi:MAG: hypothetical protein HY426_00505 [Candidatus Levybacteria bacterium]|nr:hypothetical protein [Candidatus Levybacteria bacterium]
MAGPLEADRRATERNMDLLMRRYVRQYGEKVSEAHSTTHLKTTARLTELGGILYGFSTQEALLAHFAGLFHDLARSPNEGFSLNDREFSAKRAREVLVLMDMRGLFRTTPEERAAVGFAIENHGEAPAFFIDPDTRDKTPKDLKDRIHAVLFIADKIEANGARVIARRSSFVAGDRLHNPEGDLQSFGFRPDRDEALAVVQESMIRLGITNPQHIYPQAIRSIVDPLYDVQREFVRGIFSAKGIRVSDIAKLFLDRKRTDGKNMLDSRELSAPQDQGELTKFLEERAGISDEDIAATAEDVANSAIEAILYFSRGYRVDMDDLINSWMPRGEAAERWRAQMVEYSSGKWFNQAREQIVSAAKTHE